MDTFLVSWATCTSMCLLMSNFWFHESEFFARPSLSSCRGDSADVSTSEAAVKTGVVDLDPAWLTSEISS